MATVVTHLFTIAIALGAIGLGSEGYAWARPAAGFLIVVAASLVPSARRRT